MATLEEQTYSTEYTGLVSTASLCLGFITIMTVAFETFTRLPRNLSRKKRPGRENEPPSIEDYTMAYLYRPRAFLGKNRGPQIPKWPFLWLGQVAKLNQRWYLRHSGLDSAVYVRFVTACWFFMVSQLITTVVVLLPLHIYYAPDDVLPSSISQASVSSLISSTSGGRQYLWVHSVILWWQSICWVIVVIYVGWGNICMRREQILEPLRDAKDGDRDEEQTRDPVEGLPPGIDHRGWRFRTCKVSNIPQHMRNEKALINYFDACLAFIKKNPSAKFYEPAVPVSSPTTATNSPSIGHVGDGQEVVAPSRPESSVVHVVIVRKLDELHELVDKRKEVLHELEAAHVVLARQVMAAVATHVRTKANQPNLKERVLRVSEKEASKDMDILVEALGQFLPVDSKEGKIWNSSNPEKRTPLPNRTIWEALADLPPKLLDPYQPTTKLKVFRGQVAPSIDYFLTKLNLLTSLIDDLRSRPDTYAACDTAFVTFKTASDARLAKRELSWIRARGLTCRVRMAPDARDLDWNKLVQSNFRGDVLRGFIVHALVWAATIVWILPMGALVGLVSIDNLSTRIPQLARWLNNHTRAKSLLSSLAPTIIVTIVNMLVPTIMIQVSGRGQTFVTLSKLHHATWCRYWKWVIINVVIAFCAGTALFTSLLGIFTGESFEDTANNPLNVIASSFSNGAVFFVSYTILIIGTQCFFELAQFMIPWFLFLGARKAVSPRQRFAKTEPRRFFSYTVSPNHTLVISIILVFSRLNPLPICFVFIYFSFAFFIFKDHFARLYWRVYYEGNGRLFYTRIMRFSLDALVLGQVVTMALFFVLKDTKNGGACAALIPLTVITKLILTRWYETHMNAADAAFADVVTGQKTIPQQQASQPTTQAREESPEANKALNRRSVNKRLGGLALPDLSIMDTLKLPLHARKNLKTDKGPQGAIVRLAKRLHHSGAYTEIRESNTARAESNVEAAKDLSAPSAEKTLQALEDPAGRPRALSAASALPQRTAIDLVVPHSKLQRDDRPDFSAPYVDPYLVQEVERHLWLPRDPLYAIDLDDTIDWYGRALVSSEGGDGQIGAWNPIAEESADEDDLDAQEIIIGPAEHSLANSPLSIATPHTSATRPLRSSTSSVFSGSPRKASRPSGNERIRLAQDVTARQASGSFTANPLSLALSRTQSDLSASNPQPLPSSLPAAVPASAALLDVEEGPARFQRSASVGNVLSPEAPNILAPRVTYEDLPPLNLRRAHSEILDPINRDNITRRDTLALPPPNTAPVTATRGRSHSAVSRNSGASGVISQSRALAHEVLQEERTQAIERRRVEDKKMMQKFANSRKAWRNWFMKAPDNQD